MSKRPANSRNTLLDAAHDLGLTACSGGNLFGTVVFNPSLPAIYSEAERGRLGGAFWNSVNPVNAAAFGVALLTWLPYRLAPSRVVTGRRTRALLTVGPRTAWCRSGRAACRRPGRIVRRP